jgi:hypothetical protein
MPRVVLGVELAQADGRQAVARSQDGWCIPPYPLLTFPRLLNSCFLHPTAVVLRKDAGKEPNQGRKDKIGFIFR